MGDLDQQRVPGGMAELVVDRLEIVQIEVQERKRGAGFARFVKGVGQSLVQQKTVGKIGQRVVMGEMPDSCLIALAISEIAKREHRRRLPS